MPQDNLSNSTHFQQAVETATFSIQQALVRFRDHVSFDDEFDPSILASAILFSSIFEDNHAEFEKLISEKEQG